MDSAQITAFCEYALGNRVVGGSDPGDPVDTPHAPELRAFCVARLGEHMPRYPWMLARFPRDPQQGGIEEQARAFAGLLRAVADGIDPQATEASPFRSALKKILRAVNNEAAMSEALHEAADLLRQR